jgi:hypothetical protein
MSPQIRHPRVVNGKTDWGHAFVEKSILLLKGGRGVVLLKVRHSQSTIDHDRSVPSSLELPDVLIVEQWEYSTHTNIAFTPGVGRRMAQSRAISKHNRLPLIGTLFLELPDVGGLAQTDGLLCICR